MAPQGRMRSSLMWDEQFGDGYVKWVSGSSNELSIGYDDVKDAYEIFSQNILQVTGSVSFKNTGLHRVLTEWRGMEKIGPQN